MSMENNTKLKPWIEWMFEENFPDLSQEKYLAVDLETCDLKLLTHGSGWATGNGYVTGFALATKDWQAYYPIAHEKGPNMDPDKVIPWIKKTLSYNMPKIFHNASYDIGWLRHMGITVNGTIHDTMISSALIDENRFSFTLNSLAKDKLGATKNEDELVKYAQDAGINPKKEMYKIPAMYVGHYAEQDARLTYDLFFYNQKEIEEQKLQQIYDLETRLQPCLIDMRAHGVRVDLQAAEEAKQALITDEEAALFQIKKLSGVDVNVWAAASVAKAFDNMHISYSRTPTGKPSFTKNFLSKHKSDLAQLVVKARESNKAHTTFIDSIMRHQHNGRLHSEIHQMRSDDKGTVTGRFSYSNPNLQQIPARNKKIKNKIRSLFIPEEGKKWGSFDYSQQEPRMVVHFAERINEVDGFSYESKRATMDTKRFIEGYRKGEADFHKMVAEMADIERDTAKTINLGLFYGMGQGKLKETLGVDDDTAQILINDYNDKVPFVKKLSRRAMESMEGKGYVTTIYGRRCRSFGYVPIKWGVSGFYKTEQEAKAILKEGNYKKAYTYKALNKLIQGSAADQTKKAMVDLYEQDGIIPHIQVHDELNISIEGKEQAERIIKVMENCIELNVPSKVDCEIADNWGDAKGS
jgi:DNA polymerase I-like protein with 3'-5' exonuclease and polymerase domains